MMKLIKKETNQNSLIHQRIRNASFVPLESQDTEKFKYNILLRRSKYINDTLIVLKTFCNKIIQRPQLWLNKVDFKAIKSDTATWLIEASIEGFVVNFVVWALIGWRFNIATMFAWGFAIKQLLSIYRRLKKDGSNPTISYKNN